MMMMIGSNSIIFFNKQIYDFFVNIRK